MKRTVRAMSRHLLVLAALLLVFISPAVGSARSQVRVDPVVAAGGRFAAYSMGNGTQVAKIVITLGANKWYFDVHGRKVYRMQEADVPMGGVCGGWAVLRANAFDRYGNDIYGPVRLLLQNEPDGWKGRMLGHGFADSQLHRLLRIDDSTIRCLRDHGLWVD